MGNSNGSSVSGEEAKRRVERYAESDVSICDDLMRHWRWYDLRQLGRGQKCIILSSDVWSGSYGIAQRHVPFGFGFGNVSFPSVKKKKKELTSNFRPFTSRVYLQ